VLDLTELDRDAAASVDDLRRALDRIEHPLSPGEIVLVRTGNDGLCGARRLEVRGTSRCDLP